jgi:uncharacterized repeat protein (TIGR03806 family)
LARERACGWLALAAAGIVIAALGGCDADAEDTGPWPDLEAGLDEREPLACAAPAALPDRISQHPCFTGSPPRPVAGFVPYGVQAPFWSDGLSKQRAIAVPDGAEVVADEHGTLVLPAGSIAVKELRDGERPVETRLLTIGDDGRAAGASYRWDESGADADRVDKAVEVQIDGGRWTVPGRDDCGDCHTGATGLLGLRVAQLNGDLVYPGGRAANQIATWARIGLLDVTDLARPDELERMARPDDQGEPESGRARAYLDSNCAHCHGPGGEGGTALDLRWTTPLDLTRACDRAAELGDPWDGEGRLVAPGRPDRSILLSRIASDDPLWRMPPVGSARVDKAAVDLLATWTDDLSGCEGASARR